MPYVQRDAQSRIVAIFAVMQPGIAEEWVDGEPELYVSSPRQGDAGWFWLRLFTAEERARWSLLLKHADGLSAPQLAAETMLFKVVNADLDIQCARIIDLDNAAVIGGVSVLCRHNFDLGGGMVVTVLANDQRRDEVLSGLIVA